MTLESWRLKMATQMEPRALGKSTYGKISEDLGRTAFRTSSANPNAKGVSMSDRKYYPSEKDGNNGSSEDELILKPGPSSPIQPVTTTDGKSSRKTSKLSKPSSMRTQRAASGSRPRPRPNHRGTLEGGGPISSSSKRLFRSLDALNDDVMPPSNQLALRLQLSQRHSFDDEGPSSSPLDELSPNRARRPKPYGMKGRYEPAILPSEAGYQATRSKKPSSKRVRPFPMDTLPSPKGVSQKLQPQPFSTAPIPKAQHTRIVDKAKPTRKLERFPLDNTPSRKVNNVPGDEDDKFDSNFKRKATLRQHKALQPFPMSMSQFSPKAVTKTLGSKRPANDNDDGTANKKHRLSPGPTAFDSFRLVSLDEEVDPETICAYCDEPWPSSPSPTLLSLLERTKRKSYRDPRPGNALGLRAPLSVFVELCQRHRFEMTHLPLALACGWPTSLDFTGLPDRIRGLKSELLRFIERPDESDFWRMFKDEVKQVGRAKVASVSGQYATFERTQPGYYGEQGSIIIYQTLCSLFPLDQIPEDTVDPLTPDQFLTSVLVPETAIFLIKEDMHLSTKKAAMSVMDESKKYGLAMFPEQAEGGDIAEIGENLAKERARAMRKLLEERGETDADIRRQVERENRRARKAKGKRKRKDQPESGEECGTTQFDTDHGKSEKDGRVTRPKQRVKVLGSSEDIPENGFHRREGNGSSSMVNSSDRATPRPARTTSVSKNPSNIISWRSKRSPSTSPLNRPDGSKVSSRSSLHEGDCDSLLSPLKPSARKDHQKSRWVSNYRDDTPSSDHEDVDFVDMVAQYESSMTAEDEGNSDSDVVILEDSPITKPKPKSNMKAIIRDSDSQFASDVITTKSASTSKPKAGRNGRAICQDLKFLGKTNRRRKGKDKNKDRDVKTPGPSPIMEHAWLLEDVGIVSD